MLRSFRIVSELDFCPAVRPHMARRSGLGACARPLLRPREPGQPGAWPGMTASVWSTAGARPGLEHPTGPTGPGGRTCASRHTSPSSGLSSRGPSAGVRRVGAAASAAHPWCRVRTRRGGSGGRWVGLCLWWMPGAGLRGRPGTAWRWPTGACRTPPAVAASSCARSSSQTRRAGARSHPGRRPHGLPHGLPRGGTRAPCP